MPPAHARTAPGTSMVSVNWMLDDIPDPDAALALTSSNARLVGTPAAPLRKALIDSGLGEAPAGGGLDDDLQQPMFLVGLKGIDPADADKVEALILDTLDRLAATASTADDRSGTQHARVPPAREQYRLFPARHLADVPLDAHLAARWRPACAAALRGTAGRGARRPCRRSAFLRRA